MKKILFLLAMLLGVVACDTEKPTPTPPSTEEATLELTSAGSLWFDAEGGEGVITYTLENAVKGVDLTATSSVEWIEVKDIAQSITYVVAKNEMEEDRRGTITVEYGDKSFSVSVMQRAQLNADVVLYAKTLNGSYNMDEVEGAQGYS
jgi:hypothetical protein